jgi:ferric-dicitrate binding protein FerR (iron transport regulator)
MFQAWIDGELSLSERVILEQHLAECKLCTALLRKHQRSAARLFEAFEEHRLANDLKQQVMEHLPEMGPLRINVEGVNWREKVPGRRTWVTALIPVVAVGLVLILAGVLYFVWPQTPVPRTDAVGIVTQSLGPATCITPTGAAVAAIPVKSYIVCGNYYETGPGGRLLLTLRGPTHLRVDENTRLRVHDDRELSVDAGHVLFDVSNDERQFRVNTPSGRITVLGTVFDIRVSLDKTIVTLKSGSVQVANDVTTDELSPGEQLDLVPGQKVLARRKVDAGGLILWADSIVPNQAAYKLFAREIQPRTIAELQAEQVFVIVAGHDRSRSVSSFFLTWEPDAYASGHCGYDVHVYNNAMQEIFEEHIDAGVFADKTRRSYEVHVPGEPLRDVDVVHLKIIPDFSTGEVRTSFTKVSALSI